MHKSNRRFRVGAGNPSRMGWICWLVTLPVLIPAASQAAEVNGKVTKPSDWSAQDRAAWQDASTALGEADFRQWFKDHAESNSFYRACIENTQHKAANEYSTIAQRQAYYDVMGAEFEYGKNVPSAAAPIRFFHATGAITTRGLLGYVESNGASSGVPGIGIPKETIDLTRSINTELFKLNVGVIHNVLYEWHQPRDPTISNATDAISPLAFDLKMVELEQNTVQKMIETTPRMGAAVDGLNTALSIASHFNPAMRDLQNLASKAGEDSSAFQNIRWRKAIGRALVFRFHNAGEREYLNYMLTDSLRPPDVRNVTRLAYPDMDTRSLPFIELRARRESTGFPSGGAMILLGRTFAGVHCYYAAVGLYPAPANSTGAPTMKVLSKPGAEDELGPMAPPDVISRFWLTPQDEAMANDVLKHWSAGGATPTQYATSMRTLLGDVASALRLTVPATAAPTSSLLSMTKDVAKANTADTPLRIKSTASTGQAAQREAQNKAYFESVRRALERAEMLSRDAAARAALSDAMNSGFAGGGVGGGPGAATGNGSSADQGFNALMNQYFPDGSKPEKQK